MRNDSPLGPKLSEDQKLFARAYFKQVLFREIRRIYRKLRIEKDITQADIANRLGVDEALISRRLKGESNLTLDTVADLMAAMKARIEPRAITEDEASKQAPMVATVFLAAEGAKFEHLEHEWASDSRLGGILSGTTGGESFGGLIAPTTAPLTMARVPTGSKN